MVELQGMRLTVGDGPNTLTLEPLDDIDGVRWMRATLTTPDLTAAHVFHELEGVADFHDIVRLFEGFAIDWRGWEGERSWIAADADVWLLCTHDGIGQVVIAVTLRDWVDEWELQGLRVLVEPGHLDALAEAARAFGVGLEARREA